MSHSNGAPVRQSARAASLAAQQAEAAAAAAAAQAEFYASESASVGSGGDHKLRIRMKHSSYRELSEREMQAESRAIERRLDLEQRRRTQEDIDAEEAEEAAALAREDEEDAAETAYAPVQESRRRSSRERRSARHYEVVEDGDDAFDAAQAEEEDAAEAELDEAQEAMDDAADGDYVQEQPTRERLSRSAKTASQERVREQIQQRAVSVSHSHAPTIVERLCLAVDTLKLFRKPGGFVAARLRNFLCSDEEGVDKKAFSRAMDKALDLGLLVKVDSEASEKCPRYKLDRPAFHRYQNPAPQKRHSEGGSRRNSLPESGDDSDVVPVNRAGIRVAAAAAVAVADAFLDPTAQLLSQLKDAVCPWNTQVRESERNRGKRVSAAVAVPLSQQPTRRSSRRNADLVELRPFEIAEHKSQRNSSAAAAAVRMEDVPAPVSVKHAPSLPVSSLSSLKGVPVSSLSSLPRPDENGALAANKHEHADDGEDDDEVERKEGPDAAAAKAEEDEDDTHMEDAPAASAAAAGASSATEFDTRVSSFLRQRGQNMLSDFLLLSILRAPQHKMALDELQVSLAQQAHVPPAFVEWALHSTPAASGGDAAPSPLEACLAQLVSTGMLQAPGISRDRSYRATTAALDVHKQSAKGDGALLATVSAADANGTKSRGGRNKSRANLEHDAKLRTLKQLMSLRQQGFVEAHKGVLGPFISNPKERARHHIPLSLRSDVPPSDESRKTIVHDFPLHPIPSSIVHPELVRPYQIKGFSFMADLHDKGAAGILADEMGLGKTLQTILFLAWLREHRDIPGPHMVVVPLNVLTTWVEEVARWCPSMRVVRFHGSEKERQRLYAEQLQFGTFDVLVTTYETVVLAQGFFRHHFLFAYVVVDEAHRIKNEKSLLAVALRHVPALNRLLLTGTPLQNNLHELWALLNYLYPHLFPVSLPFDAGFDLTHHHVNNDVLLNAQALLGPIMIRRLKRDVADKLPPKTETQVHVKLAPFQVHWYKAMLASHAGLLEQLGTQVQKENNDAAVVQERLNADLESSGDAIVLEQQAQLDAEGNISSAQLAALPEDPTPEPAGGAARGRAKQQEEDGLAGILEVTAGAGNEWRKLMSLLMQLRKVCNHPYVFGRPDNASRESLVTSSGKMKVLDLLLKKLLRNKHRVLIFSNFTSMLDLLEEFCQLRRYPYLRLDGSSNRVQRRFDIARFNAPNSEFPIFLISTRAGGLGINLQTADTVILYDSDWNPQIDLQAQDRAHRLGQTRPVRVFRLVCAQSVEERVVARAQRKLYLDAMVTQGAVGLQQSTEQLERLSKSEVLGMLAFGSDALFSSNGEIEERDIDTILAGARTQLIDDANLEQRAKQVLGEGTSQLKSVKENCATFDFQKIKHARITEFGGKDFSSVARDLCSRLFRSARRMPCLTVSVASLPCPVRVFSV